MLLFIDTTDPELITLALLKNAREFVKSWPANNAASELLPQKIREFLAEHKVGLKDLTKVAVCEGPGHFSRLRTGIATANALAFSLKVPVISVKKSEKFDFKEIFQKKGSAIALPKYGKAPNITAPKPKKLLR